MNEKTQWGSVFAFVAGMLLCLGVLVVITPKDTAVVEQPYFYNPYQQEQVPPEPEYLDVDRAAESIQAAEMKEWLGYLASKELDGRRPNTPGYAKAADYVEKYCRELGLKTERQEVPGRDQNVFAYIEGVGPSAGPDIPYESSMNEVIVVGAHLDHLGNGRLGADDNGSGSVAVMAIAKAFSKMSLPRRTIVFQWYTAEESGLVGSRYYCDNPTFPKSRPDIKKHLAMINLDMVGRMNRYYAVQQLPQLTAVAPDLYGFVDELDQKYSFAKRITKKGAGGSDHTPFLRKGIPAVFIHTGTHRDYHRSSDTVEKINYEGMQEVTRYGFELARKCTESPSMAACKGIDIHRVPVYHDHMDGVPFPNPF